MGNQVNTGRGSTGVPSRPSKRQHPPRPPRNRPPRRARRGGSRRRTLFGIIGVAVVVVVAAIVAVVVGMGSSSGGGISAVNFTLANGTKVYGGIGPERIPLEVGPQLAAPNTGLTGAPIDGIQCNTSEQLIYHHHFHVAIFVDGKPYSVPLGVGMVPPAQVQKGSNGDFATGSSTCLYWLHVHAQDGIVHIESPQPGTFELGQFFGVWHQNLSANKVGPYSGAVTATVNGRVWPGNPAQIPLNEHTQIVLNVGGPVVNPPPISWNGSGL